MNFPFSTVNKTLIIYEIHRNLPVHVNLSSSLTFKFRVFFQSVGNGAGSLAIGKIAQFWYDLGKVRNNMNLIK